MRSAWWCTNCAASCLTSCAWPASLNWEASCTILTATVVPPSGDWLLVRPDGVGELDVRSTLQAQDGALLYVPIRGYITRVMELLPRWLQGEEIPREDYYFVVTPSFETGAAQYDWLQRTITVGIGSLVRGGIRQEIFAVS